MNTKGPGQIEVTFEYSRHVGSRFIHGSVTLSFDSLRPYSFVSKASWPESDNYEEAVRKAVEEVLIECQGSLDKTHVTLKRVGWDSVASCEFGFIKAAQAATREAFNI